MKFLATKKVKKLIFSSPLFCCCWIRDPRSETTGSGIKHFEFAQVQVATLPKTLGPHQSGSQIQIRNNANDKYKNNSMR
jgi:hypothetical protein